MSEEFQQNSVKSLHEANLNSPISTANILPEWQDDGHDSKILRNKEVLRLFLSFYSLSLSLFYTPYTDNILNIPLIMYN